MTTGSVPQSGVVAELAGGSDPPVDGAAGWEPGAALGVETAPGAAQATTRTIASAAVAKRAASAAPRVPMLTMVPPPLPFKRRVPRRSGPSCTALLRSRRRGSDHQLGDQLRDRRLAGLPAHLRHQDLGAPPPRLEQLLADCCEA